jgi:Mur ligase middle domain
LPAHHGVFARLRGSAFVARVETDVEIRRRFIRMGRLLELRARLSRWFERLRIAQRLDRTWRVLSGRTTRRARYLRARLRRPTLTKTTLIAVTGSCGKTTTTTLIGKVLSSRSECFVKAGRNEPSDSVNTLLGISAASKFCVQEVSADEPGHIVKHSRLIKPQIVVVTTIGYDHYKQYRGPEGVAREKSQLVRRLPKHGTAILNADDSYARAMADDTKALGPLPLDWRRRQMSGQLRSPAFGPTGLSSRSAIATKVSAFRPA